MHQSDAQDLHHSESVLQAGSLQSTHLIPATESKIVTGGLQTITRIISREDIHARENWSIGSDS